jgi:hypothetical protein
VELYLHSPNTSSRRGDQFNNECFFMARYLVKHRDSFTFTFARLAEFPYFQARNCTHGQYKQSHEIATDIFLVVFKLSLNLQTNCMEQSPS